MTLYSRVWYIYTAYRTPLISLGCRSEQQNLRLLHTQPLVASITQQFNLVGRGERRSQKGFSSFQMCRQSIHHRPPPVLVHIALNTTKKKREIEVVSTHLGSTYRHYTPVFIVDVVIQMQLENQHPTGQSKRDLILEGRKQSNLLPKSIHKFWNGI